MALDFFATLRGCLESEMDPAAADRVCARVAECLGGSRPYIPQRWREPQILPTDTPARVSQRNGVSRRTAQRWMDSWRT